MPADKPEPEREKAEGKEVWVTKDESGITALSEDKEAADPSVFSEDEDGEDEPSDDTDDES
jgi:hypothetical protein